MVSHFNRKTMSERWGQKNESGPLRSKRGGGAPYISAPDFSAIFFKKNRLLNFSQDRTANCF
jgi:hypothetical protein